MVHSRIMAKEQEVALAECLAAEGGIASDESVVAETVIEAKEESVEEHEKEPDENTEWEGEYGEAGCPIWMGEYHGDVRCGRKLHVAPDGVDSTPVCLMHSKDPNKQSGPLFDSFWQEFERILAEAVEGEAHFECFVFPQCFLSGKKFRAICLFNEASFTQKTNFSQATFSQKADFSGATFAQFACFAGANFLQYVDFSIAIFEQNAHFGGATFVQDAIFYDATFAREAFFSQATFSLAASFQETRFHGSALWRWTRFLDQADFEHTDFESSNEEEPGAEFYGATFSKPIEIVFDDIDLSRTLFRNCDVSQISFTSSVRWGTRRNNQGLAVFEERILCEKKFAKLLTEYEPLDHAAVEQIYHQLKKNYDSRLDYWTANEFHFGEMEMKRLAVPTDGRLLWLRQWWHRNLSFVAWYKYASDYGNSYRKPLLWLLGILLVATLLFPIPGLELRQAISTSTARVTYGSVWNGQENWTNNFWTEAKLIGKSGITAIDTATFQRTPEYTPVYPRGRVLAIVETLLTSSLFALFLLAIRRQFRR